MFFNTYYLIYFPYSQAVPERAQFNPKRPPLKENFFDRENDEEKRTKLLDQTKTLIRSQLISAGKQGDWGLMPTLNTVVN